MRVKSLRFWLSNSVGNRRELEELVQLSKLSYPDLLKQLTSNAKENDQDGRSMHPRWMLHLSARHQCPTLFQIFNHMASNEASKQMAGMSSAQSIIKLGLSQLFNKPSVIEPEPMDKNIIEYLQNTNDLRTNDSYIQMLAYGVAEVYPTQTLTAKNRQRVKEAYIERLKKMLPSLYSDNLNDNPSWIHTQNTMRVDRLLPIQLFNVSDQPLIQDLYYQYLCPHLPMHLQAHRTSAIAWLSRFGLESHHYLINCIALFQKQTHQLGKDSKQRQLLWSVNICNSLFVIVRKIIGSSLAWQKGSHNKLSHISKSIADTSRNMRIMHDVNSLVQKLPMARLMAKNMTEMNQQMIEQNLKDIVKIIEKSMKEDENKLLNDQHLLLQLHKMERNMEAQNLRVGACIRRVAEIKTLRCLLLMLHLSLSQPEVNAQQLQIMRQLFNSTQMDSLISNTVYTGDMLAEIIYANQAYLAICGDNLLSSGQMQHIEKIRHQYRNYIDDYIAGITRHNDNSIMRRYNNVEHLLSGQSRLIYHRSSIFNLKNEHLNPSIIMASLCNDNQFLSNWVTNSFKELIAQEISRNVKLQVMKVHKNQYPYFPALTVTSMGRSSSTHQIYVVDSLCKHTRINHTHTHAIVDCTKVENIQEISKYFRSLPL